SMSNASYANQTWSTTNTFDSLGRLKTTANAMGSWTHTYVGNSGLTDKITTSTGGVREVDFDYYPANQGRFLKYIKSSKTPGGTLISRHDYIYGTGSEFGQIKTWTKELPLSGGGHVSSVHTFGYDATHQLLSAAKPGDPTRTYAYDAAGNRTAKSEGGVGTSYTTANDRNQILSATGGDSVTSTYDSTANLASEHFGDGSRRLYQWDSLNRLKQITIQAGATEASGDKRVQFTYNALGQRMTQSTSTRGASAWGTPAVVYYIWHDGKIVQRRDGSSSANFAISYY